MTALATRAPSPIALFRDDGPLARALGRALGRFLRVPAAAVALAGLVPLIAVAAVGDASRPVAGAAVTWAIIAGGASSGVAPGGRVAWAGPPLVRVTEYLGLVVVASLHGASAYPAAYAVLAVLTFRHYDLVYRLRYRGVTPAPWVTALSLGWDGRLVLAFVLLVAGALPAGYFVLAAVLGVAFVGEAVYGWVVVGRVAQPLGGEDEEDDEL
jgi:hypothetical protein